MFGLNFPTNNYFTSYLDRANSAFNDRYNVFSINKKKMEDILAARADKYEQFSTNINRANATRKEFYSSFLPTMENLKSSSSKLLNTAENSVLKPMGLGSNNSNVATVTKSNAELTKFDVKVTALATAQTNTSNTILSNEKGTFAGKGSIEISTNKGVFNITTDIAKSLTNKQALTSIAAAINDKGTGVQASVVEKDGKSSLKLQSADTGAKNTFEVNTKGNLASILNFSKDVAAGDAAFEVNGKANTSSSNNVKVENGVELKLTGAGNATISKNTIETSRVVSAVKDFALSYNNAIDFMDKNKDKSAAISNFAYSLKSTKFIANSLSQIGIEADSSGKLSVNEKNFKLALQNDPERVNRTLGSATGLAGSTMAKSSSAIINGNSFLSPVSYRGSAQNNLYTGMLLDIWA